MLGSFNTIPVAPGVNAEFTIVTTADLQALALGRGTVVMLYGRIVVWMLEATTQGNTGLGAWGIRLKEADSPASSSAWSPIVDGDTTDWMTLRGFSIEKTSGAGTNSGGHPANFVDESFIIRNPRKANPDDELVMLFENSLAANASVRVNFWVRVGIILP